MRRPLVRRIARIAIAVLVACSLGPEVRPFRARDPDYLQRGGMLFVDPGISGDGSRSCATCHPGGGSDGGIYRSGIAVTRGTPGGRRTPSLFGVWQTPPYLRDGSLPTLDAAVDQMLAIDMGGAALSGPDRRALIDYVASIRPFDRGRIAPDGSPVEPATLRARRGFELFQRADCALCHPAPLFTHLRQREVGTGGRFDTPTLRGLQTRSLFGHDGRFESVEEIVRVILATRGVELTELELESLLEYLKLL